MITYVIGNQPGYDLGEAARQLMRGFAIQAVEHGRVIARAYEAKDVHGARYWFAGETGSHSLDSAGSDIDRVQAHLAGFVARNRLCSGFDPVHDTPADALDEALKDAEALSSRCLPNQAFGLLLEALEHAAANGVTLDDSHLVGIRAVLGNVRAGYGSTFFGRQQDLSQQVLDAARRERRSPEPDQGPAQGAPGPR